MRSAATVSRTAQGIHKLLYEKVVYRCGELRRQIKGQRGKLAAQEGQASCPQPSTGTSGCERAAQNTIACKRKQSDGVICLRRCHLSPERGPVGRGGAE